RRPSQYRTLLVLHPPAASECWFGLYLQISFHPPSALGRTLVGIAGRDCPPGQAYPPCNVTGCGSGSMRREHGGLPLRPSVSLLVLGQSCRLICASPVP